MLPIILLAQFGLAWLLIRYLINRDRGSKEPTKILILAGVFGALGTVAAYFINNTTLPIDLLTAASNYSNLDLLKFSYIIGITEEACKVLPLALFLYHKKYFNEVTDGLIYFGISGMIFGLLENFLYTLSYGAEVGIARIISTPFSHAAFCIIFGFILARQKVLKQSWLFIPLALIASASVHALYDFGLFIGGWLALAAFALTFILNGSIPFIYARATKIDGVAGTGAAGDNRYCRNCGWPNPGHYFYCVNCGHKS